MFINKLPSNIKSCCLMPADDVKMFRKITSPADGLLLQRDLDQLKEWSIRCGLTLNSAKCKSFTRTLRRALVQTKYFVDNVEFEQMSEIRDLGVTLSPVLTAPVPS